MRAVEFTVGDALGLLRFHLDAVAAAEREAEERQHAEVPSWLYESYG